MDAQLFQNAAAMGVGGLIADPQRGSGLLGGLSVRDQHQNLPLAFGKRENHANRVFVRSKRAAPAFRDIAPGADETREGSIFESRIARYLHPAEIPVGF